MSKLLSVLASVALLLAVSLAVPGAATAEAKGARPAKHGYVMKRGVKRVAIKRYRAWRPYWGWGYPYYWGGYYPYYGYGWYRPYWRWYRPWGWGWGWGWGWRWWW